MTVTDIICRYPDIKPVSGYAKGCRCRTCKDGNLDNQRRWRQANNGTRWAATPPPRQRTSDPLPEGAFMFDPASWMDSAACRDLDPDFMFPDNSAGVNQARAVCAACPVRTDCLNYALEHRINHGVWGGVSERGRRAMLRTRGKTA